MRQDAGLQGSSHCFAGCGGCASCGGGGVWVGLAERVPLRRVSPRSSHFPLLFPRMWTMVGGLAVLAEILCGSGWLVLSLLLRIIILITTDKI